MMPLKDRDDIDDEFPLGDGTADMSATTLCPHCSAPVEILLDPGGGQTQEYVEDCEVCCRPWSVSVRYTADGSAEVTLEAI